MLPHTCAQVSARLPGRACPHPYLCHSPERVRTPMWGGSPPPPSPADLRLLPPAQTRIIQGLVLGGFAALLLPS